MTIETLTDNPNTQTDAKLQKAHLQLNALLNELPKKALSDSTVVTINESILQINNSEFSGSAMLKLITKTKANS